MCSWRGVVVGCALLTLNLLWGEMPAGAREEQQEAAQAGSEPMVKTETVVISATKTPVPISHLTSAVEVISG